MDDYWRDYLANAGLRALAAPQRQLPAERADAARATSTPLREQVLDPWGLRHAVLTCLTAFDASRNGYYEAALCSAINDWLRAEWLERDERLRAYLTIPTLDPDAGDRGGRARRRARRLRRRAACPIRSETRWGNRRYHDAARGDRRHGPRARACTPGAGPGSAPTASGFTHTYFEDYLSNSQIVAQAQVLSLVTEGVFDRAPALRVVLLECGFSWLPPLLWRFDKDWKAVWREVPVGQGPAVGVRPPPLPRRDRAGAAAGRPRAGRAAGRDARRERHARLRQRLPARARRRQPRHAARGRSTTPAARPCCAATPPRSTGWPASSPPGPGPAARSAARGAGARGP